MKRVLAVILCLLCALFLLVACGDENTDTDTDTNQGTNNTDNQGHTHTFKTNADWSYDAQGHWYDATCDCEDVTVTKLNHTDANNDGACDVCTYTNHEHEYSEDWTANCTNHWNAADCGHTVEGINVAAHVDDDEDGRCDVCNYIIEDIHEHYYSTEWTSDAQYHWHAAVCEHKVEVMDKNAHVITAAGICTVCDAKIKDVDKTDILAVLQAAVANNNKVTGGNVIAAQIVYGGTMDDLDVETKLTNETFFVLGNGHAYVFYKTYDANDNYMGGDQQYYELIGEDELFGVVMEYGSNELQPTSAGLQKLNGYTYFPGSILPSDAEDTSTLANTILGLYEQMSAGINVSDANSNYDAEKGIYTFSYTYYTVNSTVETNPDSGEKTEHHQVYLYNVDVEFRIDENYVINVCDFTVESFRNFEADNDITYNPETGEITFNPGANPSVYQFNVSQTSGVRTYTTPYPKASLMPIDFDLSLVTGTDSSSGETVITSETPIVDTDGDGIVDLVLEKETFIRLHLGNLIPSSAVPSFMDIDDFEVTFENIEGVGTLWGTGLFQDPTFSGYMDCISFRTQDPGKYLMTIRFGQVTKKLSVTIEGEIAPDMSGDNEFDYHVQITDNNTYVDQYTYTASASGKYTFNLPAGLGWSSQLNYFEAPGVHFEENTNGATVEFDIAAGKSITYYVGAAVKGYFVITVDFVPGEVVEPEPEVPVVQETTLTENGRNSVNGANIAFVYTAPLNGKLTISYGGFVAMGDGTSEGTVTYSINNGNAVAVNGGNVANVINLKAGDRIVITVITSCYATITSAWEAEAVIPTVDITGTYDAVMNTQTGVLTIDGANGTMSFAFGNNTINYTFTNSNGVVTLSNNNGVITSNATYMGKLELGDDGMPKTFWYNGYGYKLTLRENVEEKVTLSGTYVDIEGIIKVEFSEDGTVVFTYSNPNGGESTLNATYEVSDDTVTLYNENGDELNELVASVTLTEGVPTSVGYNGWTYNVYPEGELPEAQTVELVVGDNTVSVTGTEIMTEVTIKATADGIFYITVGTNAVVIEDGWTTYLADDKITVHAEAGETYTFEVNSEDYTAGTVILSVEFTDDEEEEEEPNETELVIGNNNVNAADITFAYTAESDIKLNVSVGNAVMGDVTVTYSINGGEATTLTSGSTTEIALTEGDKLTISATTSSGHMTIKVSEVEEVVEPNGSKNNPYIIESLPYDIVLTGRHSKYYTFTATEDAKIVISYPAGCLISDLPADFVKDEAALTYTFDVKAGDVITFNPWTNETSGEFTYTVKVAEPVVVDPDEGGNGAGGGDTTGIDGTYIGSGNGRGMRIVIDTAADTLVITRAASSNSLTNFEGGSTYNLIYSEILASANNGVVSGFISGTSIMNLTFDENGVVTALTWNGATYTNFVKQ